MFFFKQKTAYELRISDWSSDVCSSDLLPMVSGLWRARPVRGGAVGRAGRRRHPYLRKDQGRARTRLSHARPDDPGQVARPARRARRLCAAARMSFVKGTSVSVRLDIGGRRSLKKTNI